MSSASETPSSEALIALMDTVCIHQYTLPVPKACLLKSFRKGMVVDDDSSITPTTIQNVGTIEEPAKKDELPKKPQSKEAKRVYPIS